MKLALMQPYFFPYLGYFDIINSVDKWVVFDNAQYIRRGWIHRNRILHPRKGWQYIVVPIKKHSHKTVIKDIMIDNEQNWKRKIIRKLQHYKKKAPYFDETIAFVEDCLAIEDSYAGIQAAKAAGMYTVALPEAPEFDLEKYNAADVKIKSLKEIVLLKVLDETRVFK